MVAHFESGSEATFKLDGAGGTPVDISAYVESVAMPGKRTAMRLPRLGGNAVAKLAGPTDTTITLSGWYHSTVCSILEAAVNEAPAVLRTFEYGPQGNIATLDKAIGEALVIDFAVDTAAETPGKWTATLEVDGAVTWGVFP